jgi:hypothetical protein
MRWQIKEDEKRHTIASAYYEVIAVQANHVAKLSRKQLCKSNSLYPTKPS